MNYHNRLHSQQSLDRRNNHIVEDPGVKELLSTCAKYNLDQGVSGMDGGFPAEILDEIRQAESLRSSSSPHSPVKDKDQEGPSSPPPLPQPPPIITTDDRQQARIQYIFHLIHSLQGKGGPTELGPELLLLLEKQSHWLGSEFFERRIEILPSSPLTEIRRWPRGGRGWVTRRSSPWQRTRDHRLPRLRSRRHPTQKGRTDAEFHWVD